MRKKKEKTLSIIIPNYNKANFIGYTIKSILSQSLLPDEIIIVDDCSTDNSREVISRYKDSDSKNIIKTVFLPQNKGVQYARNIGIEKASSTYICFVDSDDIYINKYAIEKQMKAAGPNKLIGVYQLTIDNNNNIITKKAKRIEKIKYNLNRLTHLYRIEKFELAPTHYIVSKQKVVDVGMFNYPYNLCEDTDLMMKLLLAKVKFKTINIEAKGYRAPRDAGNLSNQSEEIHQHAYSFFWKKYSILYKDNLTFYCKLMLIKERIILKIASFLHHNGHNIS